jgi:uncharacterized membrane protein
LHPFDLKSALLAKHAQHVVLIHFPIALFLTSVMFDFVAQWTRNRMMAAVAYYNLLIAAISCLPVVATGLLAWRWQLEGQRLKRGPTSAPGSWWHFLHIDMARLVAAVPRPPNANARLAPIPSAN